MIWFAFDRHTRKYYGPKLKNRSTVAPTIVDVDPTPRGDTIISQPVNETYDSPRSNQTIEDTGTNNNTDKPTDGGEIEMEMMNQMKIMNNEKHTNKRVEKESMDQDMLGDIVDEIVNDLDDILEDDMDKV